MSTVAQASYGPGQDIVYINPVMDTLKAYPEISIHVLPEIWAPRLYAKGLNTLELASSGRVAVTAHDKHALDVVVHAHPDVEHEHTYLNFANDGFTVASGLQDVLVALPSTEAAGVNDTVLTSNNLDVVAADTLTLSGIHLTADVTEAVNISASTVDLSATDGDISFSAGGDATLKDGAICLVASGNSTLTVKHDRILVDGDMDITGMINMSTVTNVETSKVADNFIDIQDGLEDEVTDGGLGSQAGIRIQTAPKGSTAAAGDAIDTYLKRFKTSEADGRAFYTGGAFDVDKYRATRHIFYKGLLWNTATNGYAAGGQKTEASRSEECHWEATGGAFRVSRIVPSAEDDLVHKLGYSFRITDLGELEIVQHKTPMNLVNGVYVPGEREPARVLQTIGHVPSA